MRKFALLFSGGVMPAFNYPRYLNDIKEIYKTLVGNYGFEKSDIFTFYANGQSDGYKRPMDLDDDGVDEFYYNGRYFITMAQFPQNFPITDNDLLFFFATNHGRLVDASQHSSGLWNWHWGEGNVAWIRDKECARIFRDFLKFKFLIVCLGQCYSGGFIDDFAGPNRVIMTACRHDEPSWACDVEGEYDEFLFHVTSALRGVTPQGIPVSGDMDGDGHVSIRDAFLYAKAHDSMPETPQYYESPAGLGSHLTLNGLIR